MPKTFHKSALLTLFIATVVFVSGAGADEMNLPDMGSPADAILNTNEEAQYGRQIMRDIRNSGMVVEDPLVNEYINEIGSRIAAQTSDGDHNFTFFVIEDQRINAFALPGGYIGVHTGLLEATRSEDELAGVVAHEVAHVSHRHIARAIHARSPRADAPLVKVNCASISKELFESEFFGHVKGAFTGAHKDRVGRFQLADGGTIFLDEVGEIPIELQSKLLRVLQESEFERVGDDITRSVDVRVIAATNKDLEKLVLDGTFREDLFYRLSVFPIEVPPLRKRREDVIYLAQHFLERTCNDFGRHTMKLTRSQADQIQNYDWPGNVRELKNVIERAVILSRGNSLRLDLSLPENAIGSGQFAEQGEFSGAERVLNEQQMKALQKRNVHMALRQTNWRVSGKEGAAELLGVKPTTLTDRMKMMGIRKPSN